jgi:hypothetical protein
MTEQRATLLKEDEERNYVDSTTIQYRLQMCQTTLPHAAPIRR